MADRPNRVGLQLGNYRLIRLLGQGGFAEVYLGEHIHLGTKAAVKVLHTQLTNEDVDAFRTEARTIAHLVHPHIVRVLDFGVEGKTPFLVMDYAPNGTLRNLHPKGTSLPVATIVTYVRQVADALQYAHDQKLIHRDIKPENMLVGQRNEVFLSDFGIALVAQSSLNQSTQEVIGTVAYMSPEQIQGKPRPASDQYSLGIVVYEWLCGDRPFQGSFIELCTQHTVALPPLLREKAPTISPDVEYVVMTALAKDPKQRFASVRAFATALEQASRLGPSQPAASPRAVTPPSELLPLTVLATPPNQSLQSTNQQYNSLLQHPYSPPPAYPTSTPPASTHQRGGRGMRNVLLIGFAVLIILAATGLFFVVHKNQGTATNETATATASTFQNPYPPHTGRLALNDPLSDNSRGYGWDEGTVSDGSFCKFIGGAYHANQTNPNYFHQCVAEATSFSNFTFEVQMTIIKGGGGGIVFCADNATGNFYYLRILQSGHYILDRFDSFGSAGKTLASGSSPAIKTGLNQTNLIAVVANRSTFDFYVNYQKIEGVSDNTYSHGEIGVTADYAPAEVVYSNAKVWTL